MLANIATFLTNKLVLNGNILSEDSEIYKYGFEMGIAQVINILSTLLIGLFLGMALESMVFLAAFMTLRTYAGGYHSSSHVKCYLISTITVIAILGGAKIIMNYQCLIAAVATGIIGTILVMSLAPIEDANKPQDEVEHKVFRKRALINLSIWTIVTAILFFARLYSISVTICLCIFIIGISVACGKYKNYQLSRNKQALIE